MRTLVIIPVLNEEDNIQDVLTGLMGLEEPGLECLVLDDHSQDHTVARAQDMVRLFPRITVMSNPSAHRGLPSCYQEGFSYALAGGYDWIACMDGDCSHQPSDLKAMMERRHEAQWLVGSRYVRGGSAPGFSWERRAISFWGNLYIRHRLGVSVRDMTSGLNLFHRRVLEAVDFDHLPLKGFFFQAAFKYLAYRKGVVFKEVPITFQKRKAGVSKFSFAMMREAVFSMGRLRSAGSKG